jgi:hypothetical protein
LIILIVHIQNVPFDPPNFWREFSFLSHLVSIWEQRLKEVPLRRHPKMSTALRHPEIDTPVVPPAESIEWREVSPYVDTFTGAPPESEGIQRRSKLKSHRRFRVSGAFCAGAVVFAQLLVLVSLFSMELKLIRNASKLDEQIRQTQLEISLVDMKLASGKSTPKLSTWATELNYRKAHQLEIDDVTTRSPMPSSATHTGANAP